MNCSFTEKISPLIDGELTAAEARDIERHLVGCSECQQVCADFLNLRSQITSFETALQPQVQNRALKKILTTRERRAPARRLQWSFGTQTAAFAAFAIVAAVIGLVVYQNSGNHDLDSQQYTAANRPSPAPSVEASKEPEAKSSPEPAPAQSPEQQAAPNKGAQENTPRRATPVRRPPVREPKPGEQFASLPDPVRSADAQTMTTMHYEKSENLLVAFRNVRLNEPGAANEVKYERERAKQLVFQNMMLRREADAAGDVQTSSLLENLEPILIDIANLPDRPNHDAVRVIRERVQRKNIVPQLRVNSALARALD